MEKPFYNSIGEHTNTKKNTYIDGINSRNNNISGINQYGRNLMASVLSNEDEIEPFRPVDERPSTLNEELRNADNDDDDDIISLTDPLIASGVPLSRRSTELDLDNVLLEELPQGRNYGIYSSVIFIISRIIGSGIFSTPGGIYRDVGGSPFLFFLAWVIATIISFLCMIVYLELGTLMPRSGGPKVFLEMIYRKPKYLASVLISLQSVIFGFTCSGAMIFGQYVLSILGFYVDINKSNISRYVGFGLIIVCCLVQSISVKTSIYVQNSLGISKLILLAILALTGIYVLIIPSSITHLQNQLHWNEFFKPTRPASISSFTSAVLQAIFSFNGWEAIYLITSEVQDPIRTLKIVGPLSLVITFFTYLFINIAYLKIVSSDEIFNSGQLIGSILFEKVFGRALGLRFLSVTVAVSAAGNVYVVLYGISRMSQEVFREGILPGSRFMAANWPAGWGTPVPTLVLSVIISGLVLLVPPPGDVFSYIINLETYTFQLLMLAITVGLFKLRKDYPDIHRPIKVPLIAPIIAVGVIGYLLVTPLFKTNTSSGLEGFPNYSWVGLLLVILYFIYWLLTFVVFPRVGGYTLHKETEVLSDGLVIKTWKKLYH